MLSESKQCSLNRDRSLLSKLLMNLFRNILSTCLTSQAASFWDHSFNHFSPVLAGACMSCYCQSFLQIIDCLIDERFSALFCCCWTETIHLQLDYVFYINECLWSWGYKSYKCSYFVLVPCRSDTFASFVIWILKVRVFTLHLTRGDLLYRITLYRIIVVSH